MIEKTRELREQNALDSIKDEKERELQALEFRLQAEERAIKESLANEELRQKALTELKKQGDLERAEIEKKFLDQQKEEIRKIADFTITSALGALETIQQAEIDRIEDKISLNDKQVTEQQERAQEGLANTLAFEEAERARLELKKQQAEKRQIRLEKIKALYSAYSAAASSGDNNAIVKVIRDFALIQGLEAGLTSFGQGTGEHGTIADAIDARSGGSKSGNSLRRGIFKGESHAKRGYGIPVLVEGGEGILSTGQMNALGADNFMKLTSALDNGVLGSDIFGNQIAQVPSVNTFSVDLGKLEGKLDSVERAIKNQPVQQVNVENLSKSYTDFIDTTIKGNKKVISRYRVNKKRI
jgi:hypothetical protein